MPWIVVLSSREEVYSRLPEGQPVRLRMGTRELCLVRLGDEVRAVSNRCPHNGESLHKGKVNFKGEIICPWHGYCFDLKTGREWQQRSADVDTFPTRLDESGLSVCV